jgi:hypothetical protein
VGANEEGTTGCTCICFHSKGFLLIAEAGLVLGCTNEHEGIIHVYQQLLRPVWLKQMYWLSPDGETRVQGELLTCRAVMPRRRQELRFVISQSFLESPR